MRHPPLAPGWIDRPHQRVEIGDLPLESGEILHDAFVTAVVHGDAARLETAAILGLTAIGSTHHRLDFLIGRAPAQRSTPSASASSSSTRWETASRARRRTAGARPAAAFPAITIRDMVESQRRALDALGVGRLAAVVGASMGGMQALQWAVSHPARMARVIAMTPMARTSRWSQLVNEMGAARAVRRRGLPGAAAACRSDAAVGAAHADGDGANAGSAGAVRLAGRARRVAQRGRARARGARPRGLRLGLSEPRLRWPRRRHDRRLRRGHRARAGEHRRRGAGRAAASDLYNPPFAALEAASAIRRSRVVRLPGVDGHRSASGVGAVSTAALRDAVADFLRSEPEES